MTFSASLVLRPVRSTRTTTTRAAAARSAARAGGVVYASGEDAAAAPEASTSSTEGKVYYTDNNGKRVSGTETEYVAALESRATYKASSITGVALGTETSGGAYETVSLGDAMAFKGPGPELINGRCAMVAFLVGLPPNWHDVDTSTLTQAIRTRQSCTASLNASRASLHVIGSSARRSVARNNH